MDQQTDQLTWQGVESMSATKNQNKAKQKEQGIELFENRDPK